MLLDLILVVKVFGILIAHI